MHSDNPKIQTLLTLGQPSQRIWPDYLSQYGFTAIDVPALINLFADEEISKLPSERAEVWAPVYAWRILGQLASEEAIEPIIDSFDTLCHEDYALGELAEVIGMIGPTAIPALTHHWQKTGRDEFSYAMAMDALCEVAKQHPETRDQVVGIYQNYMTKPFTSAHSLNGLLMGRLLDLNATEAIEAIRRLFALGCVDISCAGDLEEVEMELGLRTMRSTPKPGFADLHGFENPFEALDADFDADSDNDDIFDNLDNILNQYGTDESILDCSELDGFLAALACAPDIIMPSTWMPAIWGGEAWMPEWDSEQTFTEFSALVIKLYNGVNDDLQLGVYGPLFLSAIDPNSELMIVDDWCDGFLRGLILWGEVQPLQMQQLETCLYPIRHFCTDTGRAALSSMSIAEIQSLQESIQPSVQMLHRGLSRPGNPDTTTFIRTSIKVGRNDPCPCGSGKKYKKCCGLN
jgi:yecA family protein